MFSKNSFKWFISPALFIAAFVGIQSTEAQSTITYLSLESDPGDYVGGGASMMFTPTDGQFTLDGSFLTPLAYAANVHVSYIGKNYSHWFNLSFDAQDSSPLLLGYYPYATRYPFNYSNHSPGLSVFGDGRGCNTLIGDFNVTHLSFVNNKITSFAADFTQHCEYNNAKLKGTIAVNVPNPNSKYRGRPSRF